MSFPSPSRGRIALGVLLAVVVAVMGSLVWGFAQQVARARQMREEEIRLERAVAAKQAHYDTLVARWEYVHSDEYVEQWAREDARMGRPGEVSVVIVVPPVSQVSVTPPPTPTPEPEPQSVWKELWDLFAPSDY